MRIKPLVLRPDGRTGQLPSGDLLDGQDNFTYREIASLEEILIPAGQDMIGVSSTIVEGSLLVDGMFVIDDFENPLDFPRDNFSFRVIVEDEIIQVPQGQQMLVVALGEMDIAGELRVEGQLILDEIKDTEIPPIPPVVEKPDNFGYHSVGSTLTVSVPSSQTMVVDRLEVEGELDLDGGLFLVVDDKDDGLPPYHIVSNEVFKVASRKQLFLVDTIWLDGSLEVDGYFALGA